MNPFYIQQPTINYIISGMYENMKSITCDFEMTYDNKMIVHGEAVVNKHSEEICLIARYEDVDVKQFQMDNKINMNDLPMCVQVKLFNFPEWDRIEMLKGKNVSIDMPRFKISPNFTISMSSDMSDAFKIYGQPLMDVESREIADIRVW